MELPIKLKEITNRANHLATAYPIKQKDKVTVGGAKVSVKGNIIKILERMNQARAIKGSRGHLHLVHKTLLPTSGLCKCN